MPNETTVRTALQRATDAAAALALWREEVRAHSDDLPYHAPTITVEQNAVTVNVTSSFLFTWEAVENFMAIAAEHGGELVILATVNKQGHGRPYVEWRFTDEP